VVQLDLGDVLGVTRRERSAAEILEEPPDMLALLVGIDADDTNALDQVQATPEHVRARCLCRER
jgi:hypothetical protein